MSPNVCKPCVRPGQLERARVFRSCRNGRLDASRSACQPLAPRPLIRQRHRNHQPNRPQEEPHKKPDRNPQIPPDLGLFFLRRHPRRSPPKPNRYHKKHEEQRLRNRHLPTRLPCVPKSLRAVPDLRLSRSRPVQSLPRLPGTQPFAVSRAEAIRSPGSNHNPSPPKPPGPPSPHLFLERPLQNSTTRPLWRRRELAGVGPCIGS